MPPVGRVVSPLLCVVFRMCCVVFYLVQQLQRYEAAVAIFVLCLLCCK